MGKFTAGVGQRNDLKGEIEKYTTGEEERKNAKQGEPDLRTLEGGREAHSMCGVGVRGQRTEEKSQKDQVVTASKPSKPLLT